jgi:hypothetical protein
MKFICLIYSDETQWPRVPKEQAESLMAEYISLTKSLKTTGHYIAGHRLQPTHTGKTVRTRNGKTSHTDGPFAETKEQLGGFYLVEARDLDEAVQLGERIPGARFGAIEVRPIAEVPEA